MNCDWVWGIHRFSTNSFITVHIFPLMSPISLTASCLYLWNHFKQIFYIMVYSNAANRVSYIILYYLSASFLPPGWIVPYSITVIFPFLSTMSLPPLPVGSGKLSIDQFFFFLLSLDILYFIIIFLYIPHLREIILFLTKSRNCPAPYIFTQHDNLQ